MKKIKRKKKKRLTPFTSKKGQQRTKTDKKKKN